MRASSSKSESHIKRDLSKPTEFIKWLSDAPTLWETIHINNYSYGGINILDIVTGSPRYLYIIKSHNGHNAVIDHEKGVFRIYDSDMDELPEGADAGKFDVVII